MTVQTASSIRNNLYALYRSTLEQAQRIRARRTRNILCCLGSALHLTLIDMPRINATSGPKYNEHNLHLLTSDRNWRSKFSNVSFHVFTQFNIMGNYPPITIETGICATHPLVTWAQCARYLTTTELVVLTDSLMRRSPIKYGFTLADFHGFLDDMPSGFYSRAKCERALRLAASGTDSPMESRLRLRLAEHGIGDLTINHRLRLGSDSIDTVFLDLAIVPLRIGIEYSGRFHASQWEDDEARRTALTAAGWRILTANHTTMSDDARFRDFLAQLRTTMTQQRRHLDGDT